MDDLDAEAFEEGDRRRRRRGAGRGDRQRSTQVVGFLGPGDRVEHDGSTGHPRDLLFVDEPPGLGPAHGSDAHVRARHRGQRPGRAPAVAVEHRQRPQVPGQGREVLRDDLAERVQIRPAVGVHDALRPPRRARGVVDGDRRGLVLDFVSPGCFRRRGGPVGVRFHAQIRGGHLTWGAVFVGVDDDRVDGVRSPGIDDRLEESGIAEEEFRLAVAEDVLDLGRSQSGVEHDEHAACQRDRVVRDERLGAVGGEHGDRVPGLQSTADESFGEVLDGLGHLPVGEAAGPVDDRLPIRVSLERTLEEAQRSQGGIESGHGRSPHRR